MLKKASIPVLVLVILTIAICMTALVLFSISSNKNVEDINDHNYLSKAYIRADAGESQVVEEKTEKKYWLFGEEIIHIRVKYKK